MNKIEDVGNEIESCYCVIEWVSHFDPIVRDFYLSYNHIVNAIDNGIVISEFIEDQVATRWIKVVKDRVHIWIH
jgi:hypothetical protein